MKNIILIDSEARFKECLRILKKKNADYSNGVDVFSNFKNNEIIGVSAERGILVRLVDKLSRISTLLDKDPDVVEESIDDSISDAINYLAILGAMLKNK